MPPAPDQAAVTPPIPAWVLLLFGLVALLLLAGALVLAFSSFERFQSGIGVEALREVIAPLPPLTGSRLLYQGERTASGRCGDAVYVQVYATSAALETVTRHYDRLFRQRGWVAARGGYYPAEARRVDLVSPLPPAVNGVALPVPVLNAARSPGTTAFALTVTGWEGAACPERNLSSG